MTKKEKELYDLAIDLKYWDRENYEDNYAAFDEKDKIIKNLCTKLITYLNKK